MEIRSATLENVPTPERYCMNCICVPLQAIPRTISRALGSELMKLAIVPTVPDVCYGLWFIVHYCDDETLSETAHRWVCNLRRFLLSVCATGPASVVNKVLTDPFRWCLEARCAAMTPPNPEMNLLCLGLHMVAHDDIQPDRMRASFSREAQVDELVGFLGGGDNLHFLFIQTTTLKRWEAWATLVCREGRAWKRFVYSKPEGHVAARRVFAQFPTQPDDHPLRHAWRDTRAAMPTILMEAL